ncbi:hypothetical protein [Roseovarius sp.]|uniref:hypothetical protein n=1 Tax=Roseovarius sp. TaxID=1486281 RepID=UPI003A96A0D9
MTAPLRAETRILIGAGSFADATAALKILGRLTVAENIAFGGLLIEDRDTLNICQIPNQRVVSAGGALICAPSAAQLRTVIAADAKAFQRSLAKIAGPVGAAWSFEHSIGELVQQSLTASAGWDIVVVGHRTVHPVRGKIISLCAANSVETALEAFSDRLAKSLACEHLVFSVGDRADRTVKSRDFVNLETALAALGRINAQAVLLDLSHGPIRTPDQLRQVLEVARCPVFVFGASVRG